ncbi:MAG TPA: hypothetical protein VF941_19260 [Clostridia bacterium]
MIILDNYDEKSTCIVINDSEYTVCKENEVELTRHGEGGFSEEEELFGAYTYENKFFFLYNNKSYETDPKSISCTNTYIDNIKRRFIVKINENVICCITYKPFIDPLFMVYDGKEDEFDFLLHLSRILESDKSILDFI